MLAVFKNRKKKKNSRSFPASLESLAWDPTAPSWSTVPIHRTYVLKDTSDSVITDGGENAHASEKKVQIETYLGCSREENREEIYRGNGG